MEVKGQVKKRASQIITRSALTNNRANISSLNQPKKAVTLSEKFIIFEKKFKTVIKDVTELKRENVELHAQLRVSAEEIEKNRTEICDLRKKFEMKEVNVGSAAKIANVEEVDVGNADNITEVEQVVLLKKLTLEAQLRRLMQHYQEEYFKIYHVKLKSN